MEFEQIRDAMVGRAKERGRDPLRIRTEEDHPFMLFTFYREREQGEEIMKDEDGVEYVLDKSMNKNIHKKFKFQTFKVNLCEYVPKYHARKTERETRWLEKTDKELGTAYFLDGDTTKNLASKN